VSGTIRLGGRDLASLSRIERARRMTYMPQTLPWGLELAVIEAVISAQKATTIDEVHGDASTLRQAYDALERIGIADLAMTSLARLSGGQRQLAGLAQAIVRRPEILLTRRADQRARPAPSDHSDGLPPKPGARARHDQHHRAPRHHARRVLRQPRRGARSRHARRLRHTRRRTHQAMLARVYGVSARVRTCELGALQIIVDHALPLGNRSRRERWDWGKGVE
jgi:iron complex transport system ATP-binding protein